MPSFKRLGVLELAFMLRRRRNEALYFFIAVTTLIVVWFHGGSMVETKFETFSLSALNPSIHYISNYLSNVLPRHLTVFKHDALLENHSYVDGTQSLLYYEKLLRNTEKRPLSEYSTNRTRTILVWTENWGLWNEMPNPFSINRENWFKNYGCPVWQCKVVPWGPSHRYLNQSGIPVEDFDAVIFHDYYFNNMTEKPTKRSPHQRYIYWNLESPAHASYLKLWDEASAEGFFNWTMTYRWDSDIVNTYGYMRRFTDEEIRSGKARKKVNYAKGKSKLAAWFADHCGGPSGRMDYINRLQSYISVDIYGYCGNLTCERQKQGKCRRMMGRNYKFYIAFENSLCWDYVTEKFFYNLHFNVIPVVIDLHGNYARFAPPKSYINALDFPTVKELADYLKVLDGNDTLYNEYFWWKAHYVSEYSLHVYDLDIYERAARGLCGICSKLHDPTEPISIYTNLTKWWNHDATCKALTFPESQGNDTWVAEYYRPQYDARVIV